MYKNPPRGSIASSRPISGARDLNVGLSLRLHPYFGYVRCKDSGETVHLVLAFAACRYDQCQKLVFRHIDTDTNLKDATPHVSTRMKQLFLIYSDSQSSLPRSPRDQIVHPNV